MGMGMGAVVLMELTEDFFRFFLAAEEAEAEADDGVILVLFVLTPLVAVVVIT